MARRVKKDVLIVDDDPTLCQMLMDFFRLRGVNADVAYTGADAIKKLKEHSYKVALIDLKLPDIPGLDVIHWVQKQRDRGDLRFVQLCIITGYPPSPEEFKRVPKNVHYIEKPFTPDRLLQAVPALGRLSLKVKHASHGTHRRHSSQ